ncbi:hypothetical protein L195_g034534, partial [Trifolium pratense]
GRLDLTVIGCLAMSAPTTTRIATYITAFEAVEA